MSRSLLALGSPLKLGLLCALSTGSALLLACGSDDSTSATCKTGEVLPCTCESGRPSTRMCTGQVFTECRCESLVAQDASGDADGNDASTAMDAAQSQLGAPDAEPVDRSCGTQRSTNSVKEARPVDVIFVIDNSGSMSTEIRAIETNINDNFARILDERNVDYRVIMVAHHGSGSTDVCIRSPLSGTSCNPIPAAPVNGSRFFHYSFQVESWDSLCRILETFSTPTTAAPTGWRGWLRPDAVKVFVEVTDDYIGCSTTYRRDGDAGTANVSFNFNTPDGGSPIDQGQTIAKQFRDALFDMSPTNFGTALQPNFVWHSVIGVKPNESPTQPYLPTEGIQDSKCSTAENAAPGYQVLSMLTQGLRYPVCEGAGFDSMFLAIARNAVQSSNIECRFRIPDPPIGKYVDQQSIAVDYSGSAGKETLSQVQPSACDDKSFKVEDRDVVLCDSACARIRKDKMASLQVTYSCGIPPDLR